MFSSRRRQTLLAFRLALFPIPTGTVAGRAEKWSGQASTGSVSGYGYSGGGGGGGVGGGGRGLGRSDKSVEMTRTRAPCTRHSPGRVA